LRARVSWDTKTQDVIADFLVMRATSLRPATHKWYESKLSEWAKTKDSKGIEFGERELVEDISPEVYSLGNHPGRALYET
jgi:hypothetical protein